MGLLDRFKHGWNAFIGRDPTPVHRYGSETYIRPGRAHIRMGNDRSIINATFNRIAVDVSDYRIEHCRLDDDARYIEPIKSGLNECLTVQANIDQTAKAFKQDCAMSLLDEGSIAIVPVDTDVNPNRSGGYDIFSLRVGKVVGWYPRHVRVELYNDRTGKTEQLTLSKEFVAIAENPFYSIMNEPNSFYQQLLRKLRQLDIIDEQSASGKMDLIIQLPYTIKSTARQEQAEKRRKDIEMQLTGSRYGIAYIDGTEKVTQLNRGVENNLFTQVEYYTKMLHAQLGMPPEVFDGTAKEEVMQNYYTRTVKPIVEAIVDAMACKFLTKKARTVGQSIRYFSDPFALTPESQLGDLLEKLTRGEILTKNEARDIIGFKPIDEAKADQLSNPQLYDQGGGGEGGGGFSQDPENPEIEYPN